MIKAAREWANPPSTSSEVVGHLSTMPQWLELWKRSACRAGVMRGLALAKAYHPSFDPAPLLKGFPEFNSDGSRFDKKSYSQIMRKTRFVATQIANKMKLSSFQYGYDKNDEKVVDDEPRRVDLFRSY